MKHLKTTTEEHLANKTQLIRELFTAFQFEIKKFKNVAEKVVDPYIGYKFKFGNKRPRLFVELHIQMEKIELHLRKEDYKNHGNLVIRDAPDNHNWTLSRLVDVRSKSELPYAMSLIEQSYKDVL